MPSYQLRQTMDRSAWTSRYPRLTADQRRQVQSALIQALGGDRVVSDPDQLLAYSYDATGERHFPDVVVLPGSASDVQTAVRIANQARLPIIGRGASTNLSGGTTPVVGGMVVSFARMNQIRVVDVDNRAVRVEPGVVNADLQAQLAQLGFFYPPDPSSHRISTIGGNIAENSGGPHCVKYGVTTQHVLSLELVLADGTLLELPRVGDARMGLDLASVVIGSEGTLALVTAATLSICPLPPMTRTVLASFPTVEAATRTVSALVAARLNPSALELMDRESLRIVESYVHAGYPTEAGAVLLIELDGTLDEVERGEQAVEAVARREGALSTRRASTPVEADALWRGRRAHYGATARLAPHLWVQDVTVPRPRLAEMMDRVLSIGAEQHLLIVTAAHAGDGNLHPNIPYDPSDPDQVARLKAADRAILESCVALGGAITGEHGVGIDKAEHLPLMYNADELEAMNQVKGAFDPSGLLNPFKALWPAQPGEVAGAPDNPPDGQPANTEEVQALMRWTQAHSEPLAIRGQGRRRSGAPDVRRLVDTRNLTGVFDLDIENLSIEVGAGMTAGALSRLLESYGVEVPGIEPFMDDTIGGLVASNALYWRNSLGRGWRDVLLAAEWVDATGRALRFGRKTMKNVAGFDLAKLLVGSEGRMGVITRVTLRLRPVKPSLWVAESEPMTLSALWAAAERILASARRPEGLLLVKPSGTSLWELWCVDDMSQAARRQWLEETTESPLALREGMDAWLDIEQKRLHPVYQAIARDCYQRGFIPAVAPGLEWLSQVTADARVHVCPGTGWYEMMTPNPGPAVVASAVPAEAERLVDRVLRVFDPDQRLGW